jgi:hypothetical protein
MNRRTRKHPSRPSHHPERAPTAITVSVQGNLHERVPSAAQMVAVETLDLSASPNCHPRGGGGPGYNTPWLMGICLKTA